ncbi:MAG: beta-glucosidase, partial [Lachnospiraceae bacterium]|nr:beta-glucosidase [Lachnospiraceae bacterium]
LHIDVKDYYYASYDDSGVTGHKSSYVLEEGKYEVYVGCEVDSASKEAEFEIKDIQVLETLSEAMGPVVDFDVLKPGEKTGNVYAESFVPASKRTVNPMDRRKENIPAEIPMTGDKGYKLKDVKEGRVSLDDFVAQLGKDDLFALARGEGMSPTGVTPGIAGAFGAVNNRLKEFGIPKAGCSDGPSGIRMDCGTKAFAMPNGTCLACTFNEELIEKLYEFEGMELRKNHVDTLLGPGMNIHRNPLNGRNFEYFSEDPFLTGKIAAAQVRGMQKYGVTGTIKHYAMNNQEYMRSSVDCIATERAIREIYLKGFEIVVKEAGAYIVMTSYNRINGLHAAGNYDLNTTILRDEWGFDGLVMTDWWALANEEGEKGVISNTAVLVRAQNDLFMVMPDAGEPTAVDTSEDGINKGIVTIGEFQRTAKNIMKVLMRVPAYTFFYHEETDLDRELEAFEDPFEDKNERQVKVAESDTPGVYYIDDIDTSMGMKNVFMMEMGGGAFKLTFECAVEESVSDLAQVPLSIFKENNLVKMLTLTGAEKEFKEVVVEPIVAHSAYSFLKFYFGQGGMKIRNCRIEKTMSMEELMKQMEKHRTNGEAF